jgi:hypothetical protein
MRSTLDAGLPRAGLPAYTLGRCSNSPPNYDERAAVRRAHHAQKHASMCVPDNLYCGSQRNSTSILCFSRPWTRVPVVDPGDTNQRSPHMRPGMFFPWTCATTPFEYRDPRESSLSTGKAVRTTLFWRSLNNNGARPAVLARHTSVFAAPWFSASVSVRYKKCQALPINYCSICKLG